MNEADALAVFLATEPVVGGAAVLDWRFEVVEGEGVRVGIRNSALGGAYEGPGLAVRLAGQLELRWSDGLLSSVSLDRRALLDPAADLPDWRGAAFFQRSGQPPPLVGPTVLPVVETLDPAVVHAVAQEPASLLGLFDRLRAAALAGGIERIDGQLRASRGRRAVRTSRGFAAEWEETTCSVDLWADELVHASHARRAVPSDADLTRAVQDMVAQAPRMRAHDVLPPTAQGVLFTAGVVDELLGRLLLPNLAGRAIRDGRSPFTRADLDGGRQIVRSDVDLVVDTTLPLELASAPCSPDGVPAGRVALVADGRLASPTLDLTTAQDFGRPATPTPRGRPAALLISRKPSCTTDEALNLLGNGVVVRDLPGLHTQQARRSRYAVVAPDAQVVRDGELAGRCAVRVAGNLLDHLLQPSTQLVRSAGELGAGLLVLSGVELLPA